jgi:hypothetical protein
MATLLHTVKGTFTVSFLLYDLGIFFIFDDKGVFCFCSFYIRDFPVALHCPMEI